MSPLRKKMTADLIVRGLSENTQKSYLQSVTGLAHYFGRSPDLLSPQEIQQYLIYQIEERHLSLQSCNTMRCGLRFFYRITLGWSDVHLFVPGAKQPSTLPEILSHDEVMRVFTVATNRKHRTLLMTTYSTGLRASEVTRLQVSDIDSQRMCIRVDQGKGRKDRYVPLAPRLLEQLRGHWRDYRPALWLFPGQAKDRPMSRYGAGWIYNKAKAKAGIQKTGSLHTLRHNYATNLLELGWRPEYIQRLMGHTSIRSTMRYLHLAQFPSTPTRSPLDLLDFPKPGPH